MSKKIKTGLVHLQFWCRTSVIDKMIAERRGIAWNHQMDDDMEKDARHYFIIDKKGKYTVVPHPEIEKSEVIGGQEVWQKLEDQPITPAVQTIIDKWIDEIYKK